MNCVRNQILVIALLTLAELVLPVRPAPAQHLSFGVGAIAGAAIARWRGADANGAGSRTSFVGGGFLTVGIGKYFALEPQLLYVPKGTELTGSGVTVTYKQGYVEIPLLITGRFPLAGLRSFTPTIFAGPAIAFQTSCSFSSTGTSGPGYQVFPVSDENCDSLLAAAPGQPASIRHTDALMVFGGGFEVGLVALLARYDLGLSRFFVERPPLRSPLDIRTKAWLVSAGFRFPLWNGRPRRG
ncbi:MAG TPA: porin family protein [Gemmatimonadales bacterium]|nr:porin family protein [Gemmatimonadales bacterium]